MQILKNRSRINEELSQLMVLKEIDEHPHYKQRDIARETGINLMKVNHCIRKLIKQKYLQVDNIYETSKKLSYLYQLTPEGKHYKSELTYRFIQYSLEIVDSLESTFIRNLDLLVKNNYKKIILFGDDDTMKIFRQKAYDHDVDIIHSISDRKLDDISKGNLSNFKKIIKNDNYDIIVFLCLKNQNKVTSLLSKNGVPLDKLWRIQ